MTTHDWYADNRLAYVTRSLDGPEERSFTDHLARCSECQEAVRVLEHELAWLPMGVRSVKPRPGLQRAIARSVLGESVGRTPRWFAPVAVAASLVIAVGSYAAGSIPARREAARLAATLEANAAAIAMLTDTISVMRQASRVLQASVSQGGMQGGLLIFADERTHRWHVVMHGLPPAPKNEAYTFWFIGSDGMVKSVELTGDPTKPSFVTLEMPPKGGTVMGAALTLEPMQEKSERPMGKELAHLML